MKCPKCRSARFKSFLTSEALEVEFCGDCGVIWFESGELAEMVEAPKDMPFLADSMKRAKHSKVPCPVCEGAKLMEIPYHPEEPLHVHYCGECHGLLLESQEVPGVEEINARRKLGLRLNEVLEQMRKQGFIRLR